MHIRDYEHQITKLYETGEWATNDDTVEVTVHFAKGNDPFLCQGLGSIKGVLYAKKSPPL